MADLHVVAVLEAKAGSEVLVRDALIALAAPTRSEAGCLAYDVFESGADPATFITIERWRAQEDLDAHLQTPHVQGALASAGGAFATSPAIHPLRAVDVEG